MRFFTSITAAALCFVANIQAAPSASISTNPNQILEVHNKFRAQHSAPPLKWNDTLAQFAQNWSNGCKIAHSDRNYGENLAWGYKDWEEAITHWYDEEKQHDYNSNTMSHATGHFTQLVWVGTTQVGCGVSDCPNGPVYTCSYYPPGNVDGEFKKNVLPKKQLPR
ncbi:PR-1-like protein [Lichtheimia hyalospora FSU 10163]|nr:PR-1-like protein [Lichtheimia hyalospora FSU 10163]KAI7885813.1 PR-1-like protein [Lichtheimia hyalospora FSU 10163]